MLPSDLAAIVVTYAVDPSDSVAFNEFYALTSNLEWSVGLKSLSYWNHLNKVGFWAKAWECKNTPLCLWLKQHVKIPSAVVLYASFIAAVEGNSDMSRCLFNDFGIELEDITRFFPPSADDDTK